MTTYSISGVSVRNDTAATVTLADPIRGIITLSSGEAASVGTTKVTISYMLEADGCPALYTDVQKAIWRRHGRPRYDRYSRHRWRY